MNLRKLFTRSFLYLMMTVGHISCKCGERIILDGKPIGRASFIENPHRYLRVHLIYSGVVHDPMQCALDCLVMLSCRSFNFRLRGNFDGKHHCELLAFDKFNNSVNFETSAEYHHYNIMVKRIFFCVRHRWKLLKIVIIS